MTQSSQDSHALAAEQLTEAWALFNSINHALTAERPNLESVRRLALIGADRADAAATQFEDRAVTEATGN